MQGRKLQVLFGVKIQLMTEKERSGKAERDLQSQEGWVCFWRTFTWVLKPNDRSSFVGRLMLGKKSSENVFMVLYVVFPGETQPAVPPLSPKQWQLKCHSTNVQFGESMCLLDLLIQHALGITYSTRGTQSILAVETYKPNMMFPTEV